MNPYDPKTIEPEIYALWEAGGYFHAEPDPSRQPYTIVIPPPNVTGALHLGHALNNTLQDILTRRKRMQGFNACWLPGTDHAGIATQAVVEKRLREEQGWKRDSSNPEHRTFLVEKIWQWKEEYQSRILTQLKRMGCSCDWPRERFTLDEQCAKAVYETFFRFFKDGLIYRGLRLVNWDTQLQTAVADDEVYHETVRGHLWHIRYPIEGSDLANVALASSQSKDVGLASSQSCVSPASSGSSAQGESTGPDRLEAGNTATNRLEADTTGYLVVATTRPETMLADTAVAVHPDDQRYKHLIGKHCILPLMNRRIPIIADGMLVKKEFGTGCVKVTPGHDPNDYACWQRHQGQPDEFGVLDLLTPDGRIREGFGAYAGIKKDEARKKVVAELETLGLLEKVEPYETEVGHSDRSKTPIEPLRSEQWFVRMEPTTEDRERAAREGRLLPRLAESAMEAVRDGRVRFFPQRYEKTYLDWLGEKRDWCISRQLWWGHRIPVWRFEFKGTLLDNRGSARAIRAKQRDIAGRVQAILDDLTSASGCGSFFVRSHEHGTVLRVCASTEDAGRLFERLANGARSGVGPADPARWIGSDHPHRPFAERLWELKSINDVRQDPDVLDTWFSSALWPHSTFGWPNPNPDRKGGASVAPEVNAAQSQRQGQPANQPLPNGRGSDSGVRPLPDGRGSAGTPLDLDYFYPTSVLSTAREIITLWVARMVMTGLYNVGRVPFQHVYIHAVIQDGQGRRMSKSAGNGVDPLDIIDAYGADALRFTLAQLATETQDIRIPVKPMQLPDGRTVNTSERFELGRNLVTKLWQAATGLILPNLTGENDGRPIRIERGQHGYHTSVPPAELPLFDRWIRTRLQHAIATIDEHIDNYRFSAAVDECRGLFWGEFCDWYLEEIKVRLAEANERGDAAAVNNLKVVLLGVFDTILCLLHPAMPFVTEAIWQELNKAVPGHDELICPDPAFPQSPDRKGGVLARNATRPSSSGATEEPLPDGRGSAGSAGPRDTRGSAQPIITAPWPRQWPEAVDAAADREVGDVLQPVIRALRDTRATINNIRSQSKQPALRTLPRAVIRVAQAGGEILRTNEALVRRLGSTEQLEIGSDVSKPPQSLSRVLTGMEVYVPVAGLADLDIERKRLAKERDELSGHVRRVEGKLGNEGFVAKAPPDVVAAERARLDEARQKLAAIERNLSELG